MAVNESGLSFLPSLKHQATVKIIGPLLKDKKHEESLKQAAYNIFERQVFEKDDKDEKQLKSIIEDIGKRVNKLNIPGFPKIILKKTLLFMVIDSTIWLGCVADSTPSEYKKQYWSKTIYELIKHLQWDKFGSIDGLKTWKSYVSNRERIDIVIWNQLCLHCMEIEITKFSKTIEWKKSKESFSSPVSVYWYQKIYNRHPKEVLYQRGMREEIHFSKINELFMLRSLFQYQTSDRVPETIITVAGIKFFGKHLDYEEKLVKWASKKQYERVTNDVIIYLMNRYGKILWEKSGDWEHITGPMDLLFQTPLILFLEDWMECFASIDSIWLLYLFESIGRVKRGILYDVQWMFYTPFEKAWRTFCNIYTFESEAMAQAFVIIFNRKEKMMRKIMFEGLKETDRLILLENVENNVKPKGKKLILYDAFAKEFDDKILKNDKERELFRKIPKNLASSLF